MKGFKFIPTIETLNFRVNSLGQEAGDVLLFMTKENHNIRKCVLDLNMVMPNVVEAIEAQCKTNKQQKIKGNLPQIRKEIKTLRKMRHMSGDFPIDKLNRQITTQKTIIEENMGKINQVESTMEKHRVAAAEDMDVLAAESDELKAKIEKLDNELRIQEKEHKAIKREWERKIEYEEDLIELCKGV